VCPLCPLGCSVAAHADGPRNPGLVKNGPSGAWRGGNRARTALPRPAGATPDSLDQWSRPPARDRERARESPMPMPSRSVQPAGKRHSYGGYAGGADPPADRLPTMGTQDSGHALPGGSAGCRRHSKPVMRWGTSVRTRFRQS